MTQFTLEWEPLSRAHPGWGEIAIVPWDSEIFGFRVAHFAPGDFASAQSALFADALRAWAEANRVQLVGCSVPADAEDRCAARWPPLLQSCGWRFIEMALRANLLRFAHLREAERREAPHEENDAPTLRLARAADREAVEEIAGRAFRHGRYHADALFPRELANLRYKRWMSNAFESLLAGRESTKIYVTGEGEILGFMHVELENGGADIRLNAVDAARAPRGSGERLYRGALKMLQDDGAQSVTAKIDAANMPVVNLYARLGFRFAQPEAVFHWYAPTFGLP